MMVRSLVLAAAGLIAGANAASAQALVYDPAPIVVAPYAAPAPVYAVPPPIVRERVVVIRRPGFVPGPAYVPGPYGYAAVPGPAYAPGPYGYAAYYDGW